MISLVKPHKWCGTSAFLSAEEIVSCWKLAWFSCMSLTSLIINLTVIHTENISLQITGSHTWRGWISQVMSMPGLAETRCHGFRYAIARVKNVSWLTYFFCFSLCVALGWPAEAHLATWSEDTGSECKSKGQLHHILHSLLQLRPGNLDHLQRENHQLIKGMFQIILSAHFAVHCRHLRLGLTYDNKS